MSVGKGVEMQELEKKKVGRKNYINNTEKIDLSRVKIDEDLLKKFPIEVLMQHCALPLYVKNEVAYIAFSNISDNYTLSILNFISDYIVEPVEADKDQIVKYLGSVIHLQNEKEALLEIKDRNKEEIKKSLTRHEIEQLAQQKGIIRLVGNIIEDAIGRAASDIHLHPRKNKLELLFRIDGSLVSIRKFHISLQQALISRIKIMSGMDISEHRLPQDGRIEYKQMNKTVDMRISVMPTVYGESAVIRLLDTTKGMREIDELGLKEKDKQTFKHMLNAGYGMVLVTGPTGSGKTTTLYAAIKELVKNGPHIITVEEPVEYKMEQVTQIPVNHKTGYTFARALRNILRHDPDVIMIGEIRDGETAKIAIESALTGHLVFSTLHTNHAIGTITRLLEIGVEPYLLKDALIGVIAQRLVKKNCPHCLVEEEVSDAIKQEVGANKEEVFYKGQGCVECHNTGIKGRRSAYELLKITLELRNNIEKGYNIEVIEREARNQGMVPLAEMALDLARKKEISIMEVYKIRTNTNVVAQSY